MASPLLLCVVLCSYYSVAHGGGNDSFVTVPTSSLEPEQVCSGDRGAGTLCNYTNYYVYSLFPF
jgi:hypothetical protein